jgi:hypothetical protein
MEKAKLDKERGKQELIAAVNEAGKKDYCNCVASFLAYNILCVYVVLASFLLCCSKRILVLICMRGVRFAAQLKMRFSR